MRKLWLLGLLGLTGCANFCDTFFKARNVCRDQTAQAAVPTTVVAAPVYGCSAQVVCSGPIVTSEVLSSSVGCDCTGTVVMSPTYATCVGEPMVSSAPITTVPAGAVQPVAEKKAHPLLNPIRWMREHHESKQ